MTVELFPSFEIESKFQVIRTHLDLSIQDEKIRELLAYILTKKIEWENTFNSESRKKHIYIRKKNSGLLCSLQAFPNGDIYLHIKKKIEKGTFSTFTQSLELYTENLKACGVIKLNDNITRKIARNNAKYLRKYNEKEGIVRTHHISYFKSNQIKQILIQDYYNQVDLFNCYFDLNVHQLFQVFLDVLKGINFLHSNNVIHRDIKPENILVHIEGNEIFAVLTDFDFLTDLQNIDKLRKPAGTIFFLSPELLLKYIPNLEIDSFYLDCSSDIWSFGVTIYSSFFKKLMPWDTQLEKFEETYCDFFLINAHNKMCNFNKKVQPFKKTPFKEIVCNMVNYNPRERIKTDVALDQAIENAKEYNELNTLKIRI